MNLIIPKTFSFTVNYRRITNVLGTSVAVFEVFDPEKDKAKKGEEYFAIWDTGSTGSIITTKVVKSLKLSPIGKTKSMGVHGSKIVNAYLINLGLPNKAGVFGLRVTECSKLIGSFDVLIGMDVIRFGDFAVTNFNGITIMSFRTPSIEQIDFVKSHPPSRQVRRKMARDLAKKGLIK